VLCAAVSVAAVRARSEVAGSSRRVVRWCDAWIAKSVMERAFAPSRFCAPYDVERAISPATICQPNGAQQTASGHGMRAGAHAARTRMREQLSARWYMRNLEYSDAIACKDAMAPPCYHAEARVSVLRVSPDAQLAEKRNERHRAQACDSAICDRQRWCEQGITRRWRCREVAAAQVRGARHCCLCRQAGSA